MSGYVTRDEKRALAYIAAIALATAIAAIAVIIRNI